MCSWQHTFVQAQVVQGLADRCVLLQAALDAASVPYIGTPQNAAAAASHKLR